MMERWQLKLICAAVALIVSVVCSFLPFLLIFINCKKWKQKFSRKQKQKTTETETTADNCQNDMGSSRNTGITRSDIDDNFVPSVANENSLKHDDNSLEDLEILGYLMCFGGGVFLGTFLLHMLPEVTEILETSLLIPRNIRYPLTQLIIGIGFFMVLIVEELVQACQRFKARKSLGQISPFKKTRENQNDDNPVTGRESRDETRLENVSIDTDSANNHRSYDTIMTTYDDDENPNPHPRHHHHHHHHHDYQDSHQNRHHYSTRSIVLVLALSLHHIFEGLSIGLQKYYSNVWHLTLAVLCHETAICFSMGLQFYKDDRKLNVKSFFIILTAASIMPLGIVIGLPISEVHQDNTTDDLQGWQNILNGVLQALACGTFIFVTFFEILCDELTNGHSSALKIFFVLLGFVLMALLGMIPETAEDANHNIYTFDSNFTTIFHLTTTN